MKEWVKQVEDAWSKPANLNHQIAARVDPLTHSISQNYDVISRTAFGSNYAKGRHIFELQKELLNLVIEAMQTLYIPGLRNQTWRLLIPAGVDVTLPTLLIHHDPDIWGDDVDEFNPKRFSEGVSKASKDQLVFFPFGFGPRTCVGQNFAQVEAKVALSMILQNFSFQLSPSYSHAPHTVMMLQPQHGAHIIMYPYHAQ
uniref:Uncharacterized protein n=1 Tax=Chenopodium quinoa TaxID=63459 RepID=A0A803LFP5_CHEQI